MGCAQSRRISQNRKPLIGGWCAISNKLRKAIVSGLGSGYLPIAPGTWGSGAVCLIYLATVWGSGGRAICVNGTMLVTLALSSIGCVWLGRFAESAYGKKDPGQVTLDEWAGQAVALSFLPLAPGMPLLQSLIIAASAFVAFRIFDIIKPPPARQLEKLPFGWGVLLDDIAAGIYAGAACQIIFRLLLNW